MTETPRGQWSLQWRLVFWNSVVFLSIFAITFIVIFALRFDRVRRQFDAQLAHSGRDLANAILNTPPPWGPQNINFDISPDLHLVYADVRDASQDVRDASRDVRDASQEVMVMRVDREAIKSGTGEGDAGQAHAATP
ncbi:MAG: hypothetical protein ACR2GY_05080 [Phycisphaerales bacterium]